METSQIQIHDFMIYHGRNIYSHKPIMKMVVDIGKYGSIPTNMIPGFNEILLDTFPGLKTNYCSLGYEGGFVDRLKEGTYLAHILEHVILEMQNMLGYNVTYGKTRVIEEPSVYYLAYEFMNEICGLECSKAAVFILNCFLNQEEVDITDFLKYLKKAAFESELGPSTSAIVEEAKKRGIPITRIGNESLVRLGYGRHSRMVESTLTDATSCISADISCNKQLTKQILNEHQIPVPYGKVVYSEISAQMAANQIGVPVVIKPFDGNQGKGVHLNLTKKEDIKAAFRDASKYSSGIIVEKFVTGRDFRILVVGGKVRAVSERLPASVTGDGVHTISELVDIVNQDANRGEKHEKSLTKIRLDDAAINVLKKNGMTIDTIVPPNQIIRLRENGNLSTGGTAVDYTDIIHPDNAEIAVRAANAIGIDIAGIDIVAENISQPILETGGAVVEVNTAPGIRMHLYPSAGTPRNVAKDIVDLLFPDEESVKFPIISVTGTNGKTTVVRLIQHILGLAGKTVGMTTTSGTFIGNTCICKGDHSGPRSARSLLSNKKIDAAVLETARGGIIREGLGYDLADIGIITNIADDHLGMDGVETLNDLAFIKSLVVEAIKSDGTAVLNALDSSTPDILEHVEATVILFHKNEKIPEQFRTSQYIRVCTENEWLRIADGDQKIDVIQINEIPVTCGGLISCNIENCLAAVSALYALQVPIETINTGLKSFRDNTGRFNQYELNGFRIMLDYGHNPSGYEQVILACKMFGYNRLIGIIGLPGDRPDYTVQAVGKLCAKSFNRIYVKEDIDKRGRTNGEVAELLYNSIAECGFPLQNLSISENELTALIQSISSGMQGDLIVVFYEKLEPLKEYLEAAGAKRIY